MRFARVAAVVALIMPPMIAAAEEVSTRFGLLSVEGKSLTFEGIPVGVEGNDALRIFPGNVYRIGDEDIAIVTDIGGTICPAQFRVVTITEMGVTAITAPFGNCSEALDVEVTDARLVMSQPATAGRAAVTYAYEIGSGTGH